MKTLINSKHSSYSLNSGFTLMEVLTSIMLMSVFTVVALTSMGTVVDDARFNQTLRELEQIRAGLTGETQRLETGLRKNYGYLGDLGALPTSAQGLAALTSAPTGVSLWSANAPTQMPLYGVAYGWKGPYVYNTAQQDYTTDAWGNAYLYTDYPSPGDDGKRIRSLGSDGAVGGTGYAQDIDLLIPESVIEGRVLGYVVQSATSVMGADQEAFNGTATATIYYGDGFGGTESPPPTVTVTNGKYIFPSVPLGYASLVVNTTAPAVEQLGPSIVEVNKASTATLPVARPTTSVFGNVPMCTESEDIIILPTDSATGAYTPDGGTTALWRVRATKQIRLRIRIPTQPVGDRLTVPYFYHDHKYAHEEFGSSVLTLESIEVLPLEIATGAFADGVGGTVDENNEFSTTPTAMGTYCWDGAGSVLDLDKNPGSCNTATGVVGRARLNFPSGGIAFKEGLTYDIFFTYTGGDAWPADADIPTRADPAFNDPSDFYFRIGCKFISAASVVTGDI